MVRFLTIILLCLFVSNNGYSQHRYIKLIQKKKYGKAVKKINKAIKKSPDDVGLNYTMSRLLANKDYKDNNLERSYEYLSKSKTIFDGISDEKEIRNLGKIPFNDSVARCTFDTICWYALIDASIDNTLQGYEKYLSFYKNASVTIKNEAISKRDLAAYKIACIGDSVASYQYFIANYPDAAQKNDATKRLHKAAYKIACTTNTIEAYDAFVIKYPEADQKIEATKKKNALGFQKAKKQDNISAYKEFIKNFPDAVELGDARSRLHELAFVQAEKENSSNSYKTFIEEYPDSKQFKKAQRLFEQTQFSENTKIGDWESYKAFASNYATNAFARSALDSIYTIGLRTGNDNAIKYCLDNFSDEKKSKALILYHDLYTNDGEKSTLDQFYDMYDDPLFEEVKIKDYALAEAGDALSLYMPYNSTSFAKYDRYIKLAAPNERAFVALQRMIAPDIASKNWSSAVNKINSYKSYFQVGNKKISDLISTLSAKIDNSIKINTVGSGINSLNGGEYAPVIAADDKLLYFCGKDRKDNIGGEDIFVSRKNNNTWGSAKLIDELSSAFTNDAPLNISTDGNTMLLFKSGKLFYSEKTVDGWSEVSEFPENINAAKWQADAIISSDGKALFFASTAAGGYNINPQEGHDFYHGDGQFPSDIYVSVKNDNDVWGDPVNLGAVINTKYCERSPFLHPDMKTLYFSSDGHGGLGKLDVFKSTRLADTCWDCWSEPINMGKEINTEEGDWGYKISTDGEKAYFSKSNSAKEKDHIYWLNLPPQLRPDYVASLSGKLIGADNKPISSEINWEDLETGKIVGKSKSNPVDGSFFIVLPLGKMYGYYINKDEYFPISGNIDLRNKKKAIEIESDINMVTFKQMIQEGTAVPVNNLFFGFAKSELLSYSIPELKRVAKIIKTNNLKVEIRGHTDNIGGEIQNQTLSEERAAAVKESLINEGCDPQQLFTIGFGKSQPVASNDSEDGRAKNRRVELKFIK